MKILLTFQCMQHLWLLIRNKRRHGEALAPWKVFRSLLKVPFITLLSASVIRSASSTPIKMENNGCVGSVPFRSPATRKTCVSERCLTCNGGDTLLGLICPQQTYWLFCSWYLSYFSTSSYVAPLYCSPGCRQNVVLFHQDLYPNTLLLPAVFHRKCKQPASAWSSAIAKFLAKILTENKSSL